MEPLSRTNGCAEVDKYESLRESRKMTRRKGVLHDASMLHVGSCLTNLGGPDRTYQDPMNDQ